MTLISWLGDFVEDKMEGSGRYVYGNGDVYEGSFKAGKRDGSGMYHYAVRHRTVASGAMPFISHLHMHRTFTAS